jgi:hypothetical protein
MHSNVLHSEIPGGSTYGVREVEPRTFFAGGTPGAFGCSVQHGTTVAVMGAGEMHGACPVYNNHISRPISHNRSAAVVLCHSRTLQTSTVAKDLQVAEVLSSHTVHVFRSRQSWKSRGTQTSTCTQTSLISQRCRPLLVFSFQLHFVVVRSICRL